MMRRKTPVTKLATAPAPGSVKAALAELNEDRLHDIELDEIPEDVMLWRFMVEPYLPKQRGLIMPSAQVDQAERILAKTGRVLQIGFFGFKSKTAAGLDLSEEPFKPKVGDYVSFEMYAGTEKHYRCKRDPHRVHTVRILNDTEILTLVRDPDAIRGYL